MKGLILSGGKGTRLRPLTYTGAKQLVPVANKPVLFYAIEDLVEAGIAEIGIVISPETGDQVRQAVGDGSQFGARVSYILQPLPLGIAHGIHIARDYIGAESFVLFLGDNFIRGGIRPQLNAFRRQAMDAQIILYEMQDPSSMGVAVLDAEMRVQRVVEKPQQFISPYAVIGIYMFTTAVFDAVSAIKPSARGELEITDALQRMVDTGHNVRAHLLREPWIDTGKMRDMLDANRLILEMLDARMSGSVDEHSQIVGRVVVEQGAQIVESVIRGPAIIGARARIDHAFIGPFTAIDHDCVISHSEIENSIVMDGSRITNVRDRISDSLIGRFVDIHQSPPTPRALQLMLGDHSQVGVL